MRKFFNITLAAIALVSLSAACSKVDPVNDTPAEKVMTIEATIFDAATRVTFDPSFDSNFKPTKMAHTWQVGDKLRITDASDPTKTAEFDLIDGSGTATGKFIGTGFEAASYNVEAVPVGTFNSSLVQTQLEDGNTEHLQYVATATGVTDLTSITLAETSGIIGLIAKLPAGVAGTITSVDLATKVFNYPITVTINLTKQEDTDSDDVLKLYANAPTGFAIPAGEVFLRFNSENPDHTVYTRYQKFTTALTPEAGKFNYIKMNCAHIDQYAGAEDDGMEENPYLIADKYQLMAMKNLVEEDNTTYFKMVADVDLTGIDWVPFNYSGTYNRGVVFDGCGHKILNMSVSADKSYPSFAGVVYGTIKNVTFESPKVEGKDTHLGVVGCYIGTGNNDGECIGVTVNNADVSLTVSADKKGRYAGAFTGYVGSAGSSIQDCHVTGTTTVVNEVNASSTSASVAGGFLGYTDKAVSINDCSVSGTANVTMNTTKTGCSAGGFAGAFGAAVQLTGCTAAANVNNPSSYYTGGFVGQANSDNTSFTNCAFLGGTLSTERNNNNSPVGGFIGRTTKNTISFTGCYVDGATINAVKSGRVGGFVGDCNINNTYTSCYVKNTIISGALNAGGFAGVFYSTASKCFVESTTITANNSNNGGFVGYPEGATITDCYANATVAGGSFDNVGGFIGINKKNNTVERCYENGTVSGTASSVGAFIGHVDVAAISIKKNVAWNASLPLYGTITDGVSDETITDNYVGASGSIYEQAVTLGGWDFTTVWTTDAEPKLR